MIKAFGNNLILEKNEEVVTKAQKKNGIDIAEVKRVANFGKVISIGSDIKMVPVAKGTVIYFKEDCYEEIGKNILVNINDVIAYE